MSVFDDPGFRIGVDMKAHPCFREDAKIVAIPDKEVIGWQCCKCTKKWILDRKSNRPVFRGRAVRIKHRLALLERAMSGAVVIEDEKPDPFFDEEAITTQYSSELYWGLVNNNRLRCTECGLRTAPMDAYEDICQCLTDRDITHVPDRVAFIFQEEPA